MLRPLVLPLALPLPLRPLVLLNMMLRLLALPNVTLWPQLWQPWAGWASALRPVRLRRLLHAKR